MQTSYDSFIFMSQTLLLYATFEVKFNVLHQNLEDIDLKILEKHFQRTIQADLNLFFFTQKLSMVCFIQLHLRIARPYLFPYLERRITQLKILNEGEKNVLKSCPCSVFIIKWVFRMVLPPAKTIPQEEDNLL